MTERDFYSALDYSWFWLTSIVFISLQFLSAPYGSHNRKGWGRAFQSLPGSSWSFRQSVHCSLLSFAIREAFRFEFGFLGVWEIHYIHGLLFILSAQKLPERACHCSSHFGGNNERRNCLLNRAKSHIIFDYRSRVEQPKRSHWRSVFFYY